MKRVFRRKFILSEKSSATNICLGFKKRSDFDKHFETNTEIHLDLVASDKKSWRFFFLRKKIVLTREKLHFLPYAPVNEKNFSLMLGRNIGQIYESSTARGFKIIAIIFRVSYFRKSNFYCARVIFRPFIFFSGAFLLVLLMVASTVMRSDVTQWIVRQWQLGDISVIVPQMIYCIYSVSFRK